MLADLVAEGARTLGFVRSRRGAELTALGARSRLEEIAPEQLRAVLELVPTQVARGDRQGLGGDIRRDGQFPPVVIHMINIGEKTGDLENMLNQVSDSYDFQVKTSVDGLTSLLEPMMIILMGCVIGIIVFSIMIPMFELSNLGG